MAARNDENFRQERILRSLDIGLDTRAIDAGIQEGARLSPYPSSHWLFAHPHELDKLDWGTEARLARSL